ncbi:MAG: hypothetical protein LBF68_02040 [Christensenellaceae bacterium]|jgi:hypothetical protein|nr:hypothetical protein [Christensenellaceae bacterium]
MLNKAKDLEEFVATIERQDISEVSWTEILPSKFGNVSIKSPYWILFSLAQENLDNQSFLTTTLVSEIITARFTISSPKLI